MGFQPWMIMNYKPPSYLSFINPENPLSRGLELFWMINDPGAASLFDASGHFHEGTITGATLAGGKLSLDGTDDLLSGSAISGLSDWSVWARYTPDTVSGVHPIIDNGTILLYQSDDDIIYGFTTNGGVASTRTAAAVLAAGTGVDIFVTLSGTTITLYLDVVSVDSGTLSGTPSVESSFICGRRASLVYAKLDGNSQYFYRNQADFTECDITGDLTLQAWIMPATTDPVAIASKYTGSPGRAYLFRSSTELIFTVSSTGSNGATRISTNASLTAGTWAHVAVTYNAAGGSCIFYKNGVPLTDNSGALFNSIDSNSTPFVIGAYNTTTTPTSFFSGGIFNVCLFDDIRTPAEIAASSADWDQDCSAEGNIIGQWMLNEAASASAIDNTQGDAGRDLFPYDGGDTTFGNCGRTQDFANGKLDSMAIWNRALSAVEAREFTRNPFAIAE